MDTMTNNCTGMNEKRADLLFDPASQVPAKVQAHVAECDNCKAELAELKTTMALLGEWKAPEASPYFMTRFEARMREEREAGAYRLAGAPRYARMRAGFAYGPVGHMRPLGAMALTVMLLIGGGTYLGVTDWNHPVPPRRRAQTTVVRMVCSCWTAINRFWTSLRPCPTTRQTATNCRFFGWGRWRIFVNGAHNSGRFGRASDSRNADGGLRVCGLGSRTAAASGCPKACSADGTRTGCTTRHRIGAGVWCAHDQPPTAAGVARSAARTASAAKTRADGSGRLRSARRSARVSKSGSR